MNPFIMSLVGAGRTGRRRSVVALGGVAALAVTASPALAAVDLVPPAEVTGTVVTADTARVKLDWANSTDADLAGYHVYRATSPDGTYTRLTAKPRLASYYLDTTAPAGLRSYYRITAVDKAGNESAPVAATGVRKDGTAPTAVRTLTGSRAEEGVVLDWADNTEADLAGYVVSRATS